MIFRYVVDCRSRLANHMCVSCDDANLHVASRLKLQVPAAGALLSTPVHLSTCTRTFSVLEHCTTHAFLRGRLNYTAGSTQESAELTATQR